MHQVSNLLRYMSFELSLVSPSMQHRQSCQPWERTHHTQGNRQKDQPDQPTLPGQTQKQLYLIQSKMYVDQIYLLFRSFSNNNIKSHGHLLLHGQEST
jgi:hypothetical protein